MNGPKDLSNRFVTWSDAKHWRKCQMRILYVMKQRSKPVRLGEISLDLKLSLSQTKEILGAMIEGNVVRELTHEECTKHTGMYAGHTYELVDPKSIPYGDLE